MACEELLRLRGEAAKLRKDLEDHRKQAIQRRADDRRQSGRDTSDLDLYLRRCIQKKGSEIERHIVAHGCQEGAEQG